MTSFGAYRAGLPCKNPSCKSDGRPHPNCSCYAQGGAVHFCSGNRAHEKTCKFYKAGGAVSDGLGMPEATPPPPPLPPDDVPGSLGLSGAHHGLLGMLRDVGHPKMEKPEQHEKLLEDAKAHRNWRAAPAGAAPKKTAGTRLGDRLAERDHEGAADLMQGHPVFGRGGRDAMALVADRLSLPMQAHDTNPEALRAASDYLHSTIRGRDALKDRVKGFFDSKRKPAEPDEARRGALGEHLDELEKNPEVLLKVGGKLGHYLPEHGAMLAAHAATAKNYLESIKPKGQQMGPLDEPLPVSRGAEAAYHRQLDIAGDPLLVLDFAKDGTIQPQDLQTIGTIYPGLVKKLVAEATSELIETRSKGHEMTYRQKQGLSALLGEPLDFTQTPAAMQAVMNAAGPEQAKNQAKAEKKVGNSKATKAELEQINRVDEMAETPLESRLINRNRK